ncbi:MAG: alpha/beta hydrolase-fold protein [Anaerolineales bacterium]|jgi:enterochelin esterase-like enzyme
MKLLILSILTLCFLSSCISASAALTLTPFACTQPGTVQALTLDAVGEIGIYLPPCYDPNASRLYPVLYLLPGFGGTYREWFANGLAPLTDKLILSGEIPPLMIVTTANTYDDLDPKQIVTALIPYIDRHYHANPVRSQRSIAGGSLGGATAYVLTFQHPDLFASAGVFGNGLTTGQEAQDEAWLQAIPANLKPHVFLNSGEQDTYMLQQAKALIPYLDKYNIQHTEIFSPGDHSYSYWVTNFPAYFHWLAEDWK